MVPLVEFYLTVAIAADGFVGAYAAPYGVIFCQGEKDESIVAQLLGIVVEGVGLDPVFQRSAIGSLEAHIVGQRHGVLHLQHHIVGAAALALDGGRVRHG